MKKVPGDIIILYMCTINHLIYGSWDKKQDKQKVFSILGHFLLFWAKISKKNEKCSWRYHHFTQVYQKSWSYARLFLRYGAWRILFFILGCILAFYPPNSPENRYNRKTQYFALNLFQRHI